MAIHEQFLACAASRRLVPAFESVVALEDDDLALGCECANPVLQIEWWAHEEPQPPVRQFF